MFILNILFIILMAFAYLLALIVFIIAVALAAPVRYRLIVVKNAKLIVDFEGSWLFRLVTFSFKRYEDKKNNVLIKAFGKTLAGGIKKTKRKKPKRKKPANSQPEKPVSVQENQQQPPQQTAPESKPEAPQIKEQKKKEKPKESIKEEINKETQEPDNDKSDKKGKFDIIKKIQKYPYKKLLITKTVLLLKRIIRAIKPDIIKLKTVFGTGDPNSTGLILGVLHGAFGVFNARIDAAGDFENTRIDLDLYIKGSFTVGWLLIVLILYVISKPVWEIIRIYRGKSKLV